MIAQSLADDVGALVLAPSSQGSTWDAIRRSYGPDLEFIDESLQKVFDTALVDPRRIAVAGFSDGASYALGLGLANGALFTSIIAFSPGFVPEGGREGRPRVFISHGVADQVLPIDRTSRRIVPILRRNGYDAHYEEFDGGHAIPAEMTARAAEWLGW
jgi:predicted esterase